MTQVADQTSQVLEGPLDSIVQRLDRELSLEAAINLARRPEVSAQLSEDYLIAYSADTLQIGWAGDWDQARRFQQIALAACQDLDDGPDSLQLIRPVTLVWLEIASGYLNELPNGSYYQSATAAGTELIRRATACGDTGVAAAARLGMGVLNTYPYLARRDFSTRFIAEYDRWHQRQREEYGFGLGEPSAPDQAAMPRLEEALSAGRAYFEDVLTRGFPELECDAAHGILRIWHARDGIRRFAERHGIEEATSAALGGFDLTGGLPSRDEVVDMSARALTNLSDEAIAARAEILAWMLDFDVTPPTSELQRIGQASVELAASDDGGFVTIERVLAVTELFRRISPRHGLQLLANTRSVFEGANGSTRWRRLLLEEQCMVAGVPVDLTAVRSADTFDAAVRYVHAQALQHGWDTVDFTRSLLATASMASQWNAFDSAVNLIDHSKQIAPEFAEAHSQVFLHLSVGAQTDWAAKAEAEGDWDTAAARTIIGALGFVALELADGVSESLQILARLLEHPEAEIDLLVIGGLSHLALQVEEQLGDNGVRLLQRLYQRLSARLIAPLAPGGLVDLGSLLLCWQLAKGLHSVTAIKNGLRYIPGDDPEGLALLKEIEMIPLGASTSGDDGAPPLDEAVLLEVYREGLNQLSADTPLERRKALQRTFDARIYRGMSTIGQVKAPVVDTVEFLESIPANAVVLTAYFGTDHNGNAAVQYAAVTSETALAASASLYEPDHMVAFSSPGAQESTKLEFLAARIMTTRLAILEDPGPRVVGGTAAEFLAEDTRHGGMFGTAAQALDQFHQMGKKHLIIVPNGPLHFMPFHLIGGADSPLAKDWIITYLSYAALVAMPAAQMPARRQRELTAIGLNFGDDASGLAAIEGECEAAEIGETFGTTPLLGGEATRDAVFSALQNSRYCHIATHGTHNVAAPSFQTLYVADDGGGAGETIYAYELLSLELEGLELLTLSACETALGRYDRADNLRGISANAMLAGAHAIVGTLWPVHDDVSRLFFSTFYAKLKTSQSRVLAFRTAQLSAMDHYPQYRDWGAFYYSGDWRES